VAVGVAGISPGACGAVVGEVDAVDDFFAELDDESHAGISRNDEARAVAGLGGVMGGRGAGLQLAAFGVVCALALPVDGLGGGRRLGALAVAAVLAAGPGVGSGGAGISGFLLLFLHKKVKSPVNKALLAIVFKWLTWGCV